MTKTRLLPTLALVAALSLPTGVALSQDDSRPADTAADASMAVDGFPYAELEALVRSALPGRPLDENLATATGEELLAVLSSEESAALQGVLDESGKTVADYAAATSWLRVADADFIIIQAHRIVGADASQSLDAWLDVLTVNLGDPQVTEDSIGGRPVKLVSDAKTPEVPLLYLFSAGDVTWMIVAADQTIIGEAMDTVGADDPEEAEPESAA